MSDPYNEGRTVNRTKDHVNPYPIGSVEYNLWEDGYEDAQKEGNSDWISKEDMEEIEEKLEE